MPPSLTDLLALDRIGVGVHAADKTDLIEQALQRVQGHPAVLDAEALREAVWARERTLSTGVGLGLALPHARTAAVAETVCALLTTAHPVPYEAHDGKPVSLVFLLAGPEGERGAHVRLLGRISRLLSDAAFRQQLLDAPDATAALALIEAAERE